MINNIIRSEMIQLRNKLNKETITIKSNYRFNYIINHSQYKQNKIIYLYNSIKNELLTEKLIQYSLAADKIVCLPVCLEKNNMIFVKINRFTVYSNNRYNIKEPFYNKTNIISNKGLMILPIIAAYNKYRLGYGGGYYDRYLADKPFIYTIGIGYDFQNVEFKIKDTDIQLNEIKLF